MRHDAGEPQLFSEGRHDEVGVYERHEVGVPLAESNSEDATGSKAIETLRDLVAVARLLNERVHPDFNTQLDVTENLVGDKAPAVKSNAPMISHDRRSVAM